MYDINGALFTASVLISSVRSEPADEQLESTLQSENSSESVIEVLLEDDSAGSSTLETVTIDANITNSSLVNETATTNATTINKKFSCLIEEDYQGTSTFQVYLYI